jgi:hypothetical protein
MIEVKEPDVCRMIEVKEPVHPGGRLYVLERMFSAYLPKRTDEELKELEELESAQRVWGSKRKLVSIPEIPEGLAAEIYEGPQQGCIQRSYTEAYDVTIKYLRCSSGQLGVIDGVMAWAEKLDNMKPKPPRKQRSWSKCIDDD